MVHPKKYADGRRDGKKMVCRVCLQDHPLRFCKKFLQADYKERMKLVSSYKYCAGCLSHDHTWQTCESTGTCKRCGDTHHTLLHKPGVRPRSSDLKGAKPVKRLRRGPRSSKRQKSSGPSSSQSSARGPRSSDGQDSERPSSSQALVPSNSRNLRVAAQQDLKSKKRSRQEVVLQSYLLSDATMLKPTAVLKIISGDKYLYQRVLIDPGAECSVVSEEIARRLDAQITRVGNRRRCLISIRANYGMSGNVETYAEVRRKHRVVTPSKSVDVKIVDEFPGIQLADPQFHVSTEVQVTLGADVYPRIIRNGVMGGSFGKPLAQFTIFGYIISGPCYT